MSARNKKYSIVVLSLLVISAAVLLTCSDKILNSDPGQGIEFEIALKYADGEQLSVSELVNTYRVIIIADEDTITANLEFTDGIITGLIENVPAGPNRTIIVEGLAADATVIYRGSVAIDVIANQTVDAEVILLPIVRLVRVSPNYSGKSHGEKFISDIKVNNIPGLTSIELALDYNSGVIQLDSLKAGSNVPTGSNFSYSDEGGIEISLSHSSSLTNSAGNVTVASAFFSSASSNKCLDSTLLDLGVQSLIAPGISLAAVYVDDGKAVITSGRIKVTPDTLRFGVGIEGLNLDFKQVSITDSCGNALPFTLSTEENWIDLNTAVAGITPGTAFIDIDTSGLESGNYEGFVLVNSPRAVNSPYYILVKLTLDRGVRNLYISPGLIFFNAVENGTIPASRTIHVEEVYQNNIPFNAFEDASWMSINKTSGITPDSVEVSINTTNLSPGTYIDTVVISSEIASNSPRFVSIHYVVSAVPKFLDVIPDTLFFSAVENEGLPVSQDFRVLETGGYNIDFSAAENAPWLDLSGISGTTPDTISASIISTELDPGTYNATISVSSDFAENSPQTVTVIYTLESGPRTIAAGPTPLHFALEQGGALSEPQTFQVFETGGHNISYSALESASWFSISGVSGITPDSVTVSINSSDLTPGIYRDSIEISSEEANNSPIYVVVTLGVMVGPKTIAVDPDSLHFEVLGSSQDILTGQFRVFETGGYRIPFWLFEEIPWLSLSSESGFTEDTITVYIDPEVEPGLYVDSIWVSSDEAENAVTKVRVTLNVPSFLAVDSDSLHFKYIMYSMEPHPPLDTFTVYEMSGQTIPFNVTENIPWLGIWDVDYFTPAKVQVTAIQSYIPGIYVDSIMISSDVAENSPIFVKAVMEVLDAPAPALLVDPDTLYFIAQESGLLPASQVFAVFYDRFPSWYLLPFSVIESIPWLSVTYDEGAIEGDVNVFISSTSIGVGTHFDSIFVSPPYPEYIPAWEYVRYTIVDTISPSKVSNLNVADYTGTSAFLTWNASGDDGNSGTAAETDIRYSTRLETLLAWDNATQVEGEPSPQPFGSAEFFEVSELAQGYTYYFALDIIDDAGNRSGLSNVDSVFLPPLPPVLVSPDSGALNVSNFVTLIWHSVDNNDAYQFHYDDDPGFNSPTISYNIFDTAFTIGPLDYEKTYYWRVRTVGNSHTSEWSNVWNFTTMAATPTIKGIAKNTEGQPLSEVSISVYDSYPSGNVLATTQTGSDGYFSFFALSGAFEMYAFKSGYYPQTVNVESPDTNISIFLLPTPAFSPSDQWVDLFCDSSYSHGELIQPNDVIEAYDPDGVLCGRFIVRTEGAYGFMQVYRDESGTPEIDEGCVTDDNIILKVNGEIVLPVINLVYIYPSSHQLIEACFK